jgi:AcrR family transcriptional regulator
VGIVPLQQSCPRSRAPRSDALRNAERIVAAAYAVFTTDGVDIAADVALDDIAKAAGVGSATLYRHFANKDELIIAVLRAGFAEQVEPMLRHALDTEPDGWTGLVTVLSAALRMASELRAAIRGRIQPGPIDAGLLPVFFGQLAPILVKAQEQGSVRQDICPDDLPQLLSMLLGTIWFGGNDAGWRRYLTLLLDALRPAVATELPPLAVTTNSDYSRMARADSE